MSADRDKSKIFYYRQTHKGKNYTLQDYWQPGDALREGDRELLREVQEFYQKNGYSPRKEDMKPQLVCKLKSRFRIWKNVILAAGLPPANSAEMQLKRKEAKEVHFSYFRNEKCEYFPCHPNADPENHNCLFCYCPLYMLGDQCGGAFRYTKSGRKDCSECTLPHRRENYEYMMAKCAEIGERMKK